MSEREASGGVLARLDRARTMLAEAKTLDDLRTIRDLAEAARAYAKAAGLGKEAIANATDVKLEAERRAGEMLHKITQGKGGRPKEKLSDAFIIPGRAPGRLPDGVSLRQSSDWQALARLDEDEYRAVVDEAKTEGVISTNAVVKKARQRKAKAAYERRAAASKPVLTTPAGAILEVASATDLPVETGSVNLIVTSPPYGLDKAYVGSPDDADAWMTLMQAWLGEAHRVASEHGRLAVNVPLDTTKGGFRPTYAQTVAIAELKGWTYRFSIVWLEDNVSKSIGRGSVDSAASPHVVAPVEMIVVFHKGAWGRPAGDGDLTHDEWLEWTNGLWRFSGENRRWEDHPAPFPEELPRRLIKLLSFMGDTVLDPFCGSGTTPLVAWKSGRKAIGFDISEEYVQSARRRMSVHRPGGNGEKA